MIIENTEPSQNYRISFKRPVKRQRCYGKENKPLTTTRFKKISPKSIRMPKKSVLLKSESETNKIVKSNLLQILKHEHGKSPAAFRRHFLVKHEISSTLRTKMIDWMIEVLCSFNCTENTFFVAVDIMDAYLTKTNKEMKVDQVHLLGVTSMLLASKMEEIIPFKISTVVEKMAHGKIDFRTVKSFETEILFTLDFKLLDSPSLFIFTEFLLTKLYLHERKDYKEIRSVIVYITKMVMHDLEILRSFSLKYISASCIYICFKIIEQVSSSIETKKLITKAKTLLDLEEKTFFESSELILKLAKNFEKKFSFAKNLLKFNSFSLNNIK